jgi:hypothetical protein
MSDIQPTEADREEAKCLCAAMWHASLTGIFDPTVDKFVDVAAIEVSRIRADAVKAEREIVITAVLSMGIIYKCKPLKRLDILTALYDTIEAKVLSNDQEAHNG